MRIATWNVNSVRTRLVRLLDWLRLRQPDVLCLQELKVEDGGFPHAEVQELGYRAVTHGQKTYNGVAIVTKAEVRDVRRGMDDGVEDDQARLIAATVGGLRVVSAYFPNGQEPDSDKYRYKLLWLARLRAWLAQEMASGLPLALCGDFNVATDDRDVANPERWEGGVLYNDEVRLELEKLRGLGLVDALRLKEKAGGIYSWWDYRNLGFPKNDGLRIDYVYLSKALGPRVSAASVDRDQRKPSACPEGTKPSDHAPVLVEVELGPGA